MRFVGRILILMVLFVGVSVCAAPTFASQPIRIAAIFSLTGIAAKHNAPLLPMIRLGIEEINRQGGLFDQPIELMLLDNRSTPIGSSLAAEEAVRHNVAAVIGAHWSSHSLAMGPVLQEAGIPMISPGSTNPKVTQLGNYIFRACFIDSFQGKAIANFAINQLKAKTAIVLRNIDEAYSMQLADFFTVAFKHHQGRILWEDGYRGKAVDFKQILKQVHQLRPDVVYVPGYTRDSGLIIKQAVSLGIKATFLGGDAWDEIYAIAGNAVEGSYHSAPWHPQVPFEKSVHLQKIHQQTYGTPINNFSAPLAYDATMLLMDAIQRAGSLDRSRIRAAIAATHNFKGATGPISFDANGDPVNKAIIILKLENGGSTFVKTERP